MCYSQFCSPRNWGGGGGHLQATSFVWRRGSNVLEHGVFLAEFSLLGVRPNMLKQFWKEVEQAMRMLFVRHRRCSKSKGNMLKCESYRHFSAHHVHQL